MKTDEQDELWSLLGRAKTPTVSPFFSRNVLRAIREEKQEKPGVFAWLTRLNSHWLTLGASACAVLVMSGFAFHHFTQPRQMQAKQQSADPVMVLAQQVSTSPDYQVINHLDELLASEETSVWLDK